jgi:hypothetical protein
MIGHTQVNSDNRSSVSHRDFSRPVPPDVEHTLIWTCVPIIHPSIVPEAIAARVEQDGIWGFTGTTADPPSPSTLPSCLPALSEWDVAMDKLVRSKKATPEEGDMLRQAGCEVHEFVKNRWVESEWETAWFVNPTVREYSEVLGQFSHLVSETPECSWISAHTCLCEAQGRGRNEIELARIA